MAGSSVQVKTNTTANSYHDVLGDLMPARAFFFVVMDEVGKDGFLVRRAYTSLDDPHLLSMNLSLEQKLSEVFPEKYGMTPRDWGGPKTVAEHVMGEKITPFVSTSSNFPNGSPRMLGRPVFVDIAKAKASGATLVSTYEIQIFLQQYKALNPHVAKRVDQLARYSELIDQEVLVHGKKVPASAIFNTQTLRNVKAIRGVGRVVQVVGVVLTAYDLTVAADQSFQTKSVKPITAEAIRQAGGWGAAVAGFKLGGAAGAALGIETGPGVIVTGLVGGLVFGTAGYFGADWVAGHIYKN